MHIHREGASTFFGSELESGFSGTGIRWGWASIRVGKCWLTEKS